MEREISRSQARRDTVPRSNKPYGPASRGTDPAANGNEFRVRRKRRGRTFRCHGFPSLPPGYDNEACGTKRHRAWQACANSSEPKPAWNYRFGRR
jgi:hypothetical protein